MLDRKSCIPQPQSETAYRWPDENVFSWDFVLLRLLSGGKFGVRFLASGVQRLSEFSGGPLFQLLHRNSRKCFFDNRWGAIA
jgi:hypothetical protein